MDTHAVRQQSSRALWVGLFGAPACWSVQVMAGYAISAHQCFPKAAPLGAPVGTLTAPLLIVTTLATIGALVSGVTAFAIWRRTGGDSERRAQDVLEIGEGRTRFMALAGVLVSVLFLLAIVMSFLAFAVVPACSYGA